MIVHSGLHYLRWRERKDDDGDPPPTPLATLIVATLPDTFNEALAHEVATEILAIVARYNFRCLDVALQESGKSRDDEIWRR